jgi:hypothetical protein
MKSSRVVREERGTLPELTGPSLEDELILEGGPTPTPAAVGERVGSARQALNGCDRFGPPLGIGLMVGGVLTAVAGIPLFVIGSRQVPARPGLGNLAPTVAVGAGSGSLRWSF